MSLIELMVAMTLMVAVTPIVGSIMTSTMSTGVRLESQSRTIDELRGQLYAISRELRSANCIRTPTAADTPGNTLKFTTESQVGSTSTARHLQYQVSGGQLVRTEYDAATGGNVIGTRNVGPGLVNPNTTFELRSTPRRSIVVRLQIQFSSDQSTEQVTTTVAGRNAWLTC